MITLSVEAREILEKAIRFQKSQPFWAYPDQFRTLLAAGAELLTENILQAGGENYRATARYKGYQFVTVTDRSIEWQ